MPTVCVVFFIGFLAYAPLNPLPAGATPAVIFTKKVAFAAHTISANHPPNPQCTRQRWQCETCALVGTLHPPGCQSSRWLSNLRWRWTLHGFGHTRHLNLRLTGSTPILYTHILTDHLFRCLVFPEDPPSQRRRCGLLSRHGCWDCAHSASTSPLRSSSATSSSTQIILATTSVYPAYHTFHSNTFTRHVFALVASVLLCLSVGHAICFSMALVAFLSTARPHHQRWCSTEA